jgi:hypothetical protein
VNAIASAINNFIAGLVLKQGIIGTSVQVILHLLGYLTGRQSRQRAWAGIGRAFSLLTATKKTRELN